MIVPFLSLKDVTAMHGEEIREAARRVIDSGWYLQGKENEAFEQHYAELSLPISPCMTQEQVEYVVESINQFEI